MKTPLILKCSVCGNTLNGFETGKWNDLLDFWGGRIGNRKPLCVEHYNEKITNAIKRMGKAHDPDYLADAKRAGIVA
jgi:hypothetical protein